MVDSQFLIDQLNFGDQGASELVYNDDHQTERAAITRTDKHRSKEGFLDGVIYQTNTINQFHDTFKPLINKYDSCNAICGFMVMANVVILSKLLKERPVATQKELFSLVAQLKSVQTIIPEVEKAMKFTYEQRKQYVQAHAAEFKNDGDKKEYMRDWVANYEISDYLKVKAGNNEIASFVYFLRFNQYPQIATAKHEERERILLEEKRFGAGSDSSPVDWNLLPSVAGASQFILESFSPQQKNKVIMMTPEEWLIEQDLLQYNNNNNDARSANVIFIVDADGHFFVTVKLAFGNQNILLKINTMKGRSIGFIDAVAFDLCFPQTSPLGKIIIEDETVFNQDQQQTLIIKSVQTSNVKTCPNGHPLLTSNLGLQSNWICDGCRGDATSIRNTCTQCDYDLCSKCLL